jgi:hypothetical protein
MFHVIMFKGGTVGARRGVSRPARNELSYFSQLWYPRCARTQGGGNMRTETIRRQYRREDLRYASDMTDRNGN